MNFDLLFCKLEKKYFTYKIFQSKKIHLTMKNSYSHIQNVPSANIEQFLVTIEDPDHQTKEGEANRMIEQFTLTGLKTAVEYYNQKYPERDLVNFVKMEIDETAFAEFNKLFMENPYGEVTINKMVELSAQLSNSALETLSSLKKQIEDREEVSKKILLTVVANDDGVLKIYHSIPFILTKNKLILLRSEDDLFGQKVYETIAESLKIQLLQNKLQPEFNLEQKKIRGVFQSDQTSCHFIGLGILKDLNKNDLKELIKSTEGGVFNPTPKMLKYSQSKTYVNTILGKEDRKSPAVKKNGENVYEYVSVNKKIVGDQMATRISDKFKKFKNELKEAIRETDYLSGDDYSPSSIATKMLENQKASKLKAPNLVMRAISSKALMSSSVCCTIS